jgi:hypothetical protein
MMMKKEAYYLAQMKKTEALDTESQHLEADRIIVQLLTDLGYIELATWYDQGIFGWWYG